MHKRFHFFARIVIKDIISRRVKCIMNILFTIRVKDSSKMNKEKKKLKQINEIQLIDTQKMLRD